MTRQLKAHKADKVRK